jgi:DNA-binding transcriptional regulator YdaS (Cro superfamily)
MDIIALVVDLLGGQKKAAKKIGVTQQAVCKWVNKEMPISASSAVKIEKATDGAVTRHEIRPDIFL